MSACSRCGRRHNNHKMLVIDELPVCLECMYGKTKPFEIYPIGVVKNDLRRKKKSFGVVGREEVSRIKLFESQRPFLYKLEEEKIITIVSYLHEAASIKSIFNRGLDDKKVGIFASRTPYRLSKIGIQDVRLLKIEGVTLYVEGLDAIDNTPVLDIKMQWNAFA